MNKKIQLMNFTYAGNKYEINSDFAFVADLVRGSNSFDYFFVDLSMKQYHRTDETGVTVLKNGEPMTDFGETFSGKVCDAVDFLHSAIAAYANDMPDFKAESVDNSILYVRNIVQDELNHNGKTKEGISKCFLNADGAMLELEFATSEKAGYIGNHGDICALISRSTGNIITDVPEFYEEAAYQTVLNGEELLFKSSGFAEFIEKPALKEKAENAHSDKE